MPIHQLLIDDREALNFYFDPDVVLRNLPCLLNATTQYFSFILVFSRLIVYFFISTPYLAASRADLSFIRCWVYFLCLQSSRLSQLPKTLSVSVSFVFASDHQHPSSSLRVDVNVREPSVDERMKMRDRKIPSNNSAFTLRGRNCMNGEGSKVAAEPMIIRAIEAGTFSSDYSTLILQGGIKYEHGEGCLLLAAAT